MIVLLMDMKPRSIESRVMAGRVAKRKELSAETTPNKELLPNIIRELNVFEPRTLPIAISALPPLAAVTVVAISGREVPRATKKKAICDSLKPRLSDMAIVEETRYLAPM